MSVSQPLLVESARSVRILHLLSLTYLLMFVGYAAASGDDVPENFLADLANRGPMSPKKLFRGTNWTNYQAKFDKDVLTIKPKKASSVVLGNVLALLTFPTPSSSQPAPLYVMKFEGVLKSEKISKASCTTTLQFSQMVTGVTREDLGYFVVNLNHHLEKEKLLGVQESPSLNGSDQKEKKEGGNQTAFDFSFVIPNKNSKPVSMQVQFQFNDADANVKIDNWSITTFSDVLSKSPGPNLILNENWSLSCNRLLKEPDTRNVTKESIDDPKIMQFDLDSDKILNIVTQALDTIGMCTRVNYIGLQSSELSTVPAVSDAKGANTSQELALRILAPKRIPSTCFQEERTGILNVELFVLNDWENVLYLKTFNIIWFASELEEGEEGEEAAHASSSVVKSTFFLSQAESAKFQMYIRVSLSVPQPCNVNIGLHLAPAAQDAQIKVQSFGRSKRSKKPKRGTALSGDLFVAPVAPLDPSATMDPTLDDPTNDQLLPVKIEGLEESSSEEEWEDTDTEGNDPIIPKLLTPPKDPDDPGAPPAKSGSTMTVTIVIVVVVLGGVVAGIVWYVRTKRLRLRRFRAMNEGGDAEGEDMTAENARILVGDGEEEEDPEEPPEFDEEDVLNRCDKEISKCSINLYEQQTQELSDIIFSPSKGKSDARRLSSFLDD